MGLLEKIKGSTLVETIVATVLILIIFVISSLILNTIFRNNLNANTDAVETRLHVLEYQLNTDQLVLPYRETFEDWDISLELINEQTPTIQVLAKQGQSKKQISKTLSYVE